MTKTLVTIVVLGAVVASPAYVLGDEAQDRLVRDRPDDRSMRISDGSRFVPKDFYPEFSWETAPRYFMFGDKNRVLRPEQVRFIAEQTDFLCIEKSHGMGQLGSAELGAKHEAAAKRSIYFYIEMFYNSKRRHATLGYLSPNTFEAQRLTHAA